jgi:hypothetical protein
MSWQEVTVYCFVTYCIMWTIVHVVRAVCDSIEVSHVCPRCSEEVQDEVESAAE